MASETKKSQLDEAYKLNKKGLFIVRNPFLLPGVLLGIILTYMDFLIFISAIPGLISVFHLSLAQVTLLTDISYFATAVGAFSWGYISDRFGRKLAFSIMILIYSLGSFVTAFVGNLAELIGARAFGGFGIGGDAPTGNVIAAEQARPDKRSTVLTILAVGNVVGFALGTGIVYLFTLLHIYIMYVFLVGVLPAILVYFIRRNLKETERFQDLKKVLEEERIKNAQLETKFQINIEEAKKNPYRQLFSKGYALNTILIAIFTTYVAGIVAVSLIYFPLYFIDVKHMSYVATLSYEFIAYALAGIGYVYTGFVGNKIGRKWIMGINLIVAGFLMIGVVLMNIPAWLLLFYSLFIAIHYSQWAAWPFYVAETYPTRMRGTASNFAYAFQWAGNIILPTAVTGLLYLTGFNWNLTFEILIIIPLFILPGIVYGFKKSSTTAELEKNAI